MLKTYKIEIKPTEEQKTKIEKTIGTCRFIYNFYISHNKKVYNEENKFVTGYDFSKWINNAFLKENPEYLWLKDVSSKAVKKSIMNAEQSFKLFFKKKSAFPKFKKKNKSKISCYFPKNNKTDFTVERHRIKIPTLGFIRLKEFGYLPKNSAVKSGTITKKCDRYFISVLVEEETKTNSKPYTNGIGIDLGIKEFAICSNNMRFKNINKTEKVRKLEKSLKRQQRKLSRKYKNNKKGKATKNIRTQILKVQKLHYKLANIRDDHINKVVNEIVKTKPSYITIEDLNVKGMMKNKHLAKAIQNQGFYMFKQKLSNKCRILNIELRLVDRFFPSSKRCSNCNSVKKDLKLKDRIYKCDTCGFEIDRDYNASINLRDSKIYKIA